MGVAGLTPDDYKRASQFTDEMKAALILELYKMVMNLFK